MIKNLIEKYGIIKLRFWYTPNVFRDGAFAMWNITEERDKVSGNYKIELQICGGIYTQRFYISDLESMIKDGTVKVFVQNNLEVQYFEVAE